MAKKYYSIEEAAGRLKVTPRTLHYYEEIGLLDGVTRTDGGHRQYDETTLNLVEHILRLKDLLGISLQEIRIILEAERNLDKLRSTYHQAVSELEKAELLKHASEQLNKVIDQIDKKQEKLKIMRLGFEQRLDKTHDMLKQISGRRKMTKTEGESVDEPNSELGTIN